MAPSSRHLPRLHELAAEMRQLVALAGSEVGHFSAAGHLVAGHSLVAGLDFGPGESAVVVAEPAGPIVVSAVPVGQVLELPGQAERFEVSEHFVRAFPLLAAEFVAVVGLKLLVVQVELAESTVLAYPTLAVVGIGQVAVVAVAVHFV